MLLTLLLAMLALLSVGLGLWQYRVGRRFPLHQRQATPAPRPGITVLKPLKGCDAETLACLESWVRLDGLPAVQLLFGVADARDPACAHVRRLLADHPEVDAELVICPESHGPNAKVSTLIQLQRRIQHAVIVISDADVRVPPDLLGQLVAPLADPSVGLVNCFYRFAQPANLAMRWEAVAVNADFWSQVLQARSLKPLDFALGAVMATTQKHVQAIGGFEALANYLADDYQLGHQIARSGARIELCPVVVECRTPPLRWRDVWAHQLRWARTIRVSQPTPYFFSLLSNGTLWPLLWLLSSLFAGGTGPNHGDITFAGAVLSALTQWAYVAWGSAFCLLWRMLTALHLEARLTRSWKHAPYFWMVPLKDLLQFLLWTLAFAGNRVSWRGERFRVQPDGQLVRA